MGKGVLIVLALSLLLFGCAQQATYATPTPQQYASPTPEPSQVASPTPEPSEIATPEASTGPSVAPSAEPSPSPSPAQPAQASVEIRGFAFNPAALSVAVGTTVTWTNEDAATHQIVSDSGSELSSGPMPQGSSYSHTFNSAGTFAYHCQIHPGMKGTVTVS